METRTEPYTIKKLPDEPIVILTIGPEWRVAEHMMSQINRTVKMFDEMDEPIKYIADLREMKIGVDDMIRATNVSTRDVKNYMHHPLVEEVIVVTQSKFIELASKGTRHDVFGNVNIRVFQTVEEALAYARAERR